MLFVTVIAAPGHMAPQTQLIISTLGGLQMLAQPFRGVRHGQPVTPVAKTLTVASVTILDPGLGGRAVRVKPVGTMRQVVNPVAPGTVALGMTDAAKIKIKQRVITAPLRPVRDLPGGRFLGPGQSGVAGVADGALGGGAFFQMAFKALVHAPRGEPATAPVRRFLMATGAVKIPRHHLFVTHSQAVFLDRPVGDRLMAGQASRPGNRGRRRRADDRPGDHRKYAQALVGLAEKTGALMATMTTDPAVGRGLPAAIRLPVTEAAKAREGRGGHNRVRQKSEKKRQRQSRQSPIPETRVVRWRQGVPLIRASAFKRIWSAIRLDNSIILRLSPAPLRAKTASTSML